MDNHIIEIKKAQSRLHNLFSALFCQPETSVHGNIELYEQLAENLSFFDARLESDAKNLAEIFNSFSETAMLVEYTRLFIGPFKTVAPPYSSVYLCSDGTVFGQSTQWVIEFYRNSGLEVDFSTNEIPDHIAIEMEFLHYLSSKEIAEIELGNHEKATVLFNLQEIFLNQHVKHWCTLFCDRIILGTENEYYRNLAICFKSYLEKID